MQINVTQVKSLYVARSWWLNGKFNGFADWIKL